MRIGIFLDEWRDGGVPVLVERLERSFTAAGHEVFLFLAQPCPKREKMPKQLYLELKARLGPRCVSLALTSFPRQWRPIHFRKVLIAHRISCLLVNQFQNFIDLLQTVGADIPLISIAHSDIESYYTEYLRLMDISAAHVAVSKRIYEKTLSLTAPPQANRIRYIPCGVEDQGDFQPEPSGPLRVVYCARLDPIQKRCQDLVPIWKNYRERGGAGKLTIFGQGRNQAFLRNSFQQEIAAGHVALRGHVDNREVLAEMARSDVILNVSNFEGLPQVVLEGVTLGLYPLLSNIESGHREIVEAVGRGRLCHVGDAPAFASELETLEKNLTGLRGQRSAIRQAALRHYALKDCGQKYLELIEEMRRPIIAQVQEAAYRPSFREWIQRGCLLLKYQRYFRGT